MQSTLEECKKTVKIYVGDLVAAQSQRLCFPCPSSEPINSKACGMILSLPGLNITTVTTMCD